jgi:hypothetical protein
MTLQATDLQGFYDELKRAYYSGATSLSYEGKSFTYRSGDEMRAALRALASELGISTAPQRVVVRARKGW